jgi:soluble lytic murein transglycosylase-like protein
VGAALAAVLVSCSSAAVVPSATPSPVESATPSATATAAATPAPTAAPTASPAPNWNEAPSAANDVDALTQQLVMLEAAIRDPKISGSQLDWLGHLQQLVYSRLQDYPEWKPQVLAALPAGQRAAVNGSLEAGKELRKLSGPVPRNLPDWKIVTPAPVDDLMTYYQEAEAQFGVPWYYLAAIHLVETRMGRIRGLSSAGAQGPMQFMPATWAAYGKGDINSDHDAILGAARYLKASGAPGDMQRAFYAYNHSQAYVNALLDYAAVMRDDPAAYRGYHGWQVYYPTPDGPVLLAAGWTKT